MTVFSATDPVANMGRLGVTFMVVCGYVMLNVPTRVMLIQLVFKKNESVKEASYMQFVSTNIVISIFALLMGIAISDLSLVLGFCGAVATPMIAFILPALFTIFVRAKSEDPEVEAPVLSGKQMDMYIIFVIGVVCWVIFCTALFLKLGGYTITDDFHVVRSS